MTDRRYRPGKVHQAHPTSSVAEGSGPVKTLCGAYIQHADQVTEDLSRVRREHQCSRCLRANVVSDRMKVEKIKALAIAALKSGDGVCASKVLAIIDEAGETERGPHGSQEKSTGGDHRRLQRKGRVA